MPILARYLFRQYLPPFLLCVAVGVWVLLMNHFLRLFNLAVLKGISPAWVVGCFARLLPFFLSMALPMAFLVALLITLGQLSERGEVLALRSSGFSFREILWPFLALGAGLTGLLLYINHKAGPEGYHSFRDMYERAVLQVSRLDLEPGAFTNFSGWRIFTRDVDKEGGRMAGVYLVRVENPHAGLRVEAPEGSLRVSRGRGVSVELRGGTLLLPHQDPKGLIAASFDRYSLFVPADVAASVPRDPDMQEINTSRLRERLRDPSLDPSRRKEYLTEASLRSVLALGPFVFFWIGCPLGLVLAKHARATGLTLSLLVLLAFYGLLAVGIGLGRRDPRMSSTAPWLPVAAGLAAGAWLWRLRLAR